MLIQFTPESPDSVLEAVELRLAHDIVVPGAKGVETTLVARASTATSSSGLQIDLIAHSRKSVLQLGDWDLRDVGIAQTFATAWEPYHDLLQLTRVRLIGCRTARKLGWEAMQTLHDVFLNAFGAPVEIWGTTVGIALPDFDASGFVSTDLLKKFKPQAPGSRTEEDVPNYDAWHKRFLTMGRVNRSEVEANVHLQTEVDALNDHRVAPARLRWEVARTTATFAQVLDLTTGPAATVPGLLALPDFDLLVPAPDSDGEVARPWIRVSSFFEGQFLRVSSGGVEDPSNATLFRVKESPANSTRLEDLLRDGVALWPQPIPTTRSGRPDHN